jgi:hypothetical protein
MPMTRQERRSLLSRQLSRKVLVPKGSRLPAAAAAGARPTAGDGARRVAPTSLADMPSTRAHVCRSAQLALGGHSAKAGDAHSIVIFPNPSLATVRGKRAGKRSGQHRFDARKALFDAWETAQRRAADGELAPRSHRLDLTKCSARSAGFNVRVVLLRWCCRSFGQMMKSSQPQAWHAALGVDASTASLSARAPHRAADVGRSKSLSLTCSLGCILSSLRTLVQSVARKKTQRRQGTSVAQTRWHSRGSASDATGVACVEGNRRHWERPHRRWRCGGIRRDGRDMCGRDMSERERGGEAWREAA